MTGKMELILNAVGVALAAACLAFAANADLKDIDGNAVSNTTSFASVDGESGTVGDFLGIGGFATKDAVDDGMTALSNNLTRAIEEATPVDYAHVAQMASNAAPAAASVAKDATNYTDRVTSDLAASKRGLLDLVVYEQKIVTNSVTDAESKVVGVTTNTIPTTNSLATTGLVNALVEARVPQTRTVNKKPLSSDITLSAADVKVSLVPQTEIVETATTNDAGEVVTTVTTNATGKATVSVGDESTTFYTADKADEKLEAISTSLKGHTDSKDNPHGVTAAQVGVSLADATSVTTNGEEVVTNAVANVKRLTVDKASADITTKKYVDAATADAGKVKSVNGKTGAVELAASDVGAVATNDFAAATNALAEAISKAEPGDYAAVSNAAMTALQPVATNGLVTASVTNGLASQSSLTSLSSRVDAKRDKTDLAVYGADGKATADTIAKTSDLAAVSNAIPTAVADLSDAGDYLKTADLADNETDPKWAAWRKGSNVSLGKYASAPDQDTSSGETYQLQTAIGISAKTKANKASAFGYLAYANDEESVAFAVEPSKFYLNSKNTSLNPGSTARTLQSYLDERATTNALAEVKASIPAISATDATFSNAVLAVGLNIDTNSVAQIKELLADGAKLPTSGVATVGGLLAALAAGLAALKKSVSSLSSKVDDANAALEEVA